MSVLLWTRARNSGPWRRELFTRENFPPTMRLVDVWVTIARPAHVAPHGPTCHMLSCRSGQHGDSVSAEPAMSVITRPLLNTVHYLVCG